jgi:beta-glucosidase
MLVEPGTYELMVGPSANSLPLGIELSVTGEGSGPRPRGAWIRAELFDECANLALVPETPLAGTAVGPFSPQERATAVYRGWEGSRPGHVAVRLTADGGAGRVTVQLPRRGDTWTDAAEAAVAPGFNGELLLELDGGGQAESGLEAVRIVLAGPLTVSGLQVT